jgi:hypothetical protein
LGSGGSGEEVLLLNIFTQLFRANSMDGRVHMQQLCDTVQPDVTFEMNDHLMKEFTSEEIKQALDSIEDLKALGSNGMPAFFFKTYWDVVGEQLTKEVMGMLNGCWLPQGWNDTIIALIPKTEKPEEVTDLMPVDLCNVVYKVVSKVMSQRLREVLPEIITPHQSAFVPVMLVSENTLIAYDLTHCLLNKRDGELGMRR